jgi:hypothetical protein
MQLSIDLSDAEYSALAKLAHEELRTPEDQACYILRTTFYDLGLLQSDMLIRPKKRRLPPRQGAAQPSEE